MVKMMEAAMPKRIMVCVDQPPRKEIDARLALQAPYIWPSGTQIKVRFLDGDRDLCAKVEKYAQIWTQFANIIFLFGNDPTASVKISFLQDKSNWSKIGTDCTYYGGVKEPTMNLGQIDSQSSDDEIRGAVLHEFGHVLGCVHEHQLSGVAAIQWNKPVVYSYYGNKNNVDPPWTPQQVDQNIFATYSKNQLSLPGGGGPADPESIMIYWIDKSWTNNTFEAPVNTNLSETDKALIRKTYP